MIDQLPLLEGLVQRPLVRLRISSSARRPRIDPTHSEAQLAVVRSIRGAWAVGVCRHATHRQSRVDSAENGEGAALVGKGLQLFPCNLDSSSKNQLPRSCPDISENWRVCYASNQACSRTKSGAACSEELGYEKQSISTYQITPYN